MTRTFPRDVGRLDRVRRTAAGITPPLSSRRAAPSPRAAAP